METLPFAASYICRITEGEAERYDRAIAEYGDPTLYIHRGELHHNDLHADLTAFWELVEAA